MIRDRKHECMSREELGQLQGERLAAQVKRVYERVPFYRNLFDRAGIAPDRVRGLDDLPHLPFTKKLDLRDNYPFGLFAVPNNEVVRIHASSGTTGKPTTCGYSRGDIDMWAEVMARSLVGASATDEDVVQVAYGYGLFTGGLGAHYGAELLGASVIPISGSNTQRQLMLMQDYGTTMICCTPSFVLYLWDVAQQLGLDVAKFPLRVGVLGAEPWSEAMRRDIEQKWSIKACDIYGLSEIIGPGVSCECIEAQSGLHINDDHFLPEIIDPETGEVLPEGELGELVFTTLTKEAMPLIRYRTGDITRFVFGTLHLRADHHTHGPRVGTLGRHADHPGSERLPQPGGIGPTDVAPGGTSLSVDSQPKGLHGHHGRLGGDLSRPLPAGLGSHPLAG